MLSPTSGRTAPRLLLDLLSFDTRKGSLITPSPSPLQNGGLTNTFAQGNCRHSLMIKPEQSLLPELDSRPNSSSVFKVASYCCHCRCHFDVEIDYRGDSTESGPCPNREYPLHHFVYVSTEAGGTNRPFTATEDDQQRNLRLGAHIQHWKCTSPQCPALFGLVVRPPRLSPVHLELLIDPARLKRRLEIAVTSQPERFEGIPVARPALALNYLRTYITDALAANREGKTRFSDNNKSFLVGLGEDSAPLLEGLGFTHDTGFWQLPQPCLPPDYSGKDELRLLLDDVRNELITLIYQYPAQERQGLAGLQIGEQPARKELERVLGTLDYDKSPSSRTINLVDDQERPSYAGLGAVFDFADSLISFAYDRQVSYAPLNAPYYFECLRDVARERNSEDLATKVAVLESEGQISRKDVLDAYACFGFDGTRDAEIQDDQIFQEYRFRLANSASHREAEIRNALRILGTARGSQAILQAASNAVETYGQALAWLDITADTADDFVASMYTMKTAENSNNQEIARRAVEIIAYTRNSDSLRSFLQTGDTTVSKMDIARAYELYGIPAGTAIVNVDAEGLMWQHGNNVKEQPSRREELDSALTVIAEHHPREDLKNYARASSAPAASDTSNKPLGLENLGNTCYLNSLLQYLFIIKPLRQLVLNFDQHKVDLTLADSLKGKKVGSSQVSYASARRGLEFVAKLRELFHQMMEAPSSFDTAKPEVELARLALVRSSVEPPRRRSTLSGRRPELTVQDGNSEPVTQDKNSAALPVVSEEVVEFSDDSNAGVADDAMSDVTLVGDKIDGDMENEDVLMSDAVKIKFPEPTAVGFTDEATEIRTSVEPLDRQENENDTARLTLDQESLSKPTMVESTANLSSSTDTVPHQMAGTESTLDSGLPPSRAPPIPPRPKRQEQEVAQVDTEDLSEVALQQDVSEVLESVINKMRSAIISRGCDEDGEQIDDVRSLFYGKTKTFTRKPDGTTTSVEGIFADIQVSPLESGSCDIYTALDKEFDLAFLPDGSAQFTTISAIPQILQIHIRRGQWNFAKGQAYKNNELIKPEEILYIDQYVDTTDRKHVATRSEKWDIKTKLKDLEQRRQRLLRIPEPESGSGISSDVGSLPDALEMTANYLDSLRNQMDEDGVTDEDPLIIDGAVIDAIKQQAGAIRTEVSKIDATMAELNHQFAALFTDFRSQPYRLEAVFMHRGQAGHGHYWVYLYDPKRNMWRKYNDERVEENPNTDEIFIEGATHSATAYYLVYVQDGKKEELIDCVCRHPEERELDTQIDGLQETAAAQKYSEPYPGAFKVTPATGTWDNSEADLPNVKW